MTYLIRPTHVSRSLSFILVIRYWATYSIVAEEQVKWGWEAFQGPHNIIMIDKCVLDSKLMKGELQKQ